MSLEPTAVIGGIGGVLGILGLVFGAGQVRQQNKNTAEVTGMLQKQVDKLTAAVIRLETMCPHCRKSGKHLTIEDSAEG